MIAAPKSETRQDPINYPSRLDDQMAYLYSVLNNMDDRPTNGAYQRFEDLKREFSSYRQQYEQIVREEVKGLNDFLNAQGVPVIMAN